MLSLVEARRRWVARQFDPAPLAQVPGGWSRSLGGVDPYLALHARTGCSRAQVDQALVRGEVRIVPGVRGCIWLVPRADVPLALAVSDAQSRRTLLRIHEKLGCGEGQLSALAERAHAELVAQGSLSITDLGRRLGGHVTKFGEAGKKLGTTSDLPGALRLLEWAGRVRRSPKGGVLDTQTYLWSASADPLGAPEDPVEQARELLLRFLRWGAPASLEEFVAWSKLSKTVSTKAAAGLDLEEVEVEGLGPCWELPERPSSGPEGTLLVPSQDNLQSLRLQPGLLVHPDHHGVEVHTVGTRTATIGSGKWIFQRLVVHHGEVVGLWAWDAARDRLVAEAFRGDMPADAAAVMARTADFIRAQLGGQARAVSIDSDKAQRKRVELVERLRR